ncbi:MAG: VOC family protein [Pseudorhodoplanes sp.]|uniref:VOC family protein n=1 Tax=Pseudorhodoplanes sp. TaxID=1934341 RepID=UPI003D11943C
MPRGLDHIVHAVRDLDVGAELYRRLGFTVGARNRHPWGTHNHIVQLPGFFIEVLTVAEPDKLTGEGIPQLFGDYNRRFLEAGEGFSLLILESHDAAADARAFEAAKIAASSALRFEREGQRPDGSAVKVAFSLAFAHDALSPANGFAICQQHYPENFWNPAFQQHANGVTGIAGAVMVADNPSDHHIFMSAFAGERELQSSSAGITITTPRGDIQVMAPTAYSDHFGMAVPDVTAGGRLAALRLTTSDLAATDSALSSGGFSPVRRMSRLVVPPDQALGAALVFEAAH